MTRKDIIIKKRITEALKQCEIELTNEVGCSERNFMRILQHTVQEITDNYVYEKYDPQHVQDVANSFNK
jgi:AraC-like DNA-binding protein